jgi:flagella basal body P-ring formation protein FlgA
VPKKSIRKGSVIRETDLTYEDFPQEAINETIAQDSMQLVGQEAQKSLYRNKPIFLRDLGSRTIIKRNDMVTMLFTKGAMILQTTGRAMENGGTGDTIKVMNDHSKKIVTGKITAEGDVNVAL